MPALGGNARITVDLERQVVVRPNGEEIPFEIDPFRKHLLLNGLDEIGQTHAARPRSRSSAHHAKPGCRSASRTKFLACRQSLLLSPDTHAEEAKTMPANKKLLILPGDGIGPEVMREVTRVIDWMDRRRIVALRCQRGAGRRRFHRCRAALPITEETWTRAKEADAVLFGAVGGPKWDKLGFDMRPEIAILALRRELGLFANLRPATVLDPLVEATTLKPEVVRGLDIMIVRESTGGIYFGEPRGIETLPDGQQARHQYRESTRQARSSASPASPSTWRASARAASASVEKANVMESGLLWRQTVTALGAARISRRRSSPTCTPTIAPCSWCAIRASST